MMENRSFDHLLGLAPRRRRQAGGSHVRRREGGSSRRSRSRPTSRAAATTIPTTPTRGARVEWNNGACDGWLRAGQNDVYSIGTTGSRISASSARPLLRLPTCDRFISRRSSARPYPEPHLLALGRHRPDGRTSTSASTCRPSSTASPGRRSALGYYSGNADFLLLYQRYLHTSVSRTHAQFFKQCMTGKLPAFSYVDPNCTFDDADPHRATRETTTTRMPISAPASTSSPGSTTR